MNFKKSYEIFKKEIIDIFRDRKSIIMMVLIPILMYPIIFSIIGQVILDGNQDISEYNSVIAIKGSIESELFDFIEQRDELIVVKVKDYEKSLKKQYINAYIKINKKKISVYYTKSDGYSNLALNRLNSALEDYKNFTSDKKLKEQGIDDNDYLELEIKEVDKSDANDLNKILLASLIPVLIIVTIGLGSIYPSIDITTGEKERGTLETILTVPVSKKELFLGKYLAVSFISVITGTLNLLSIILVYMLQIFQSNGNATISLNIMIIIKLFILIIPVAMFISSMTMSACIFAKSFKDAQNIVTPIYLILMIPTFFSMMPSIELTTFKAFIPILNVCLAFKNIILGEIALKFLFIIFTSNLFYAIGGYLFVLKLFNAEEILFSETIITKYLFRRPKIKDSKYFKISDVFILSAIILILIIYIGSTAQMKSLFYGIIFTQWLLIFAPVMLVVWFMKKNVSNILFIKKFKVRHLLATLFIGLGGMFFANLQTYFIPDLGIQTNYINESLSNLSIIKICIAYFAFAISPAICEEIFFRGLILS
ncbi:MAG: ABC transporter permease subunit/CPBP intramembrane protease, partial [Clostridiales bacterium]